MGTYNFGNSAAAWLCVAALSLGLQAPTAKANAQGLEPQQFDVEYFDADALEEAVEAGVAYTLQCHGKTYELLLEPSNLRSERFRVVKGGEETAALWYAPPPRIYRGTVVGEPESVVRIGTGPDGIRGCIKSLDGWTFIEPLDGSTDTSGGTAAASMEDAPSAHRIYTDAAIDPSFLGECVAELPPGEAHAEAHVEDHDPSHTIDLESLEGPEIESASLRVLELAIDADVEYYDKFGDDSQSEIESILNVVDGIFQAELDLRLEIVMVRIWDVEPDPYESTSSNTMLQELRNYWNANETAVSRDLTHLFTGKNLDGSTVGIAYVGVACSTSVGYALSQDLSSQVLMPILVAHELGHNLGAGHDVTGTTPRYVMYPSLGISNLDEFSEESELQIDGFVAGVSCLELDDASSGGESGSGTGSETPAGGGGGGGGGPVDPLFAALAGAAWLSTSLRRRRSSRRPQDRPGSPSA